MSTIFAAIPRAVCQKSVSVMSDKFPLFATYTIHEILSSRSLNLRFFGAELYHGLLLAEPHHGVFHIAKPRLVRHQLS